MFTRHFFDHDAQNRIKDTVRRGVGSKVKLLVFLCFAWIDVFAGPIPSDPGLPTGVKLLPDVIYGNAGGMALTCDIYLPKVKTGKSPAIVFIHGGGWVVGEKRQLGPVYSEFVQNGYIVMDINYRLKKPYPASVDDCQRAVRWLRSHADDYGIDATKIGAVGQSAGGHLASMLGVCDTLHKEGDQLDDYSSRVQAVVNQFGPTQVVATTNGWEIPDNYDGSCDCLGVKINREASPLFHVDTNSAPFLMTVGSMDKIVNYENMLCMARVLAKANVEAQIFIWPNQGHGNGQYDPLVWKATLEFFERHLPTTRP